VHLLVRLELFPGNADSYRRARSASVPLEFAA